MATNKFSIDFDELEGMLDDLKRVGGNVDKAVEKALEQSHAYITPLIEDKVSKSNLPHQGIYSSVDRRNSLKQIIKNPNITWIGQECSVDIGFKLDDTLVPIFLIRGGQSKPVKGLKTLLEGNKTREEIIKLQQEVIMEEILKVYER